MTSERELEIKLRLGRRELDKFAALDALKAIRPERAELHTVYFDDHRRRLATNGVELRVRTSGNRHVQTVKSGTGIARGEWEAQIRKPKPSRRAALGTPAEKYIKKWSRLEPVFDVIVNRCSWKVVRDNSEAQVSIDTGEIVSRGGRQEIFEGEIELKDGSLELVFDLAREAIRRCNIPVSFVSKGMRGSRLDQGTAEKPERNLQLQLDNNAFTAQAFQHIVAACLRQVSINEEILSDHPGSIEATHQMRVAVRRLRAAFSMFKKVIDGEDARKLTAEMKWVSDLLGEARDLDVFVDERAKETELRHPGVAGVGELSRRSEAMRSAAHTRLGEALRSKRFRNFLLAIVEFAHNGAWMNDKRKEPRNSRKKRFVRFAAEELDRRLRKIRKKSREKVITGIDESQRHRLRIEAKKLRYMMEFLQSLPQAKEISWISRKLKCLQKALGIVHDGVGGEQMVSRLLQHQDDAQIAFAAGLMRREFATTARCIQTALSAHSELRHLDPFGRVLGKHS